MNVFECFSVGFTVFGLVAFVVSFVGMLALPYPVGAGIINLGL